MIGKIGGMLDEAFQAATAVAPAANIAASIALTTTEVSDSNVMAADSKDDTPDESQSRISFSTPTAELINEPAFSPIDACCMRVTPSVSAIALPIKRLPSDRSPKCPVGSSTFGASALSTKYRFSVIGLILLP